MEPSNSTTEIEEFSISYYHPEPLFPRPTAKDVSQYMSVETAVQIVNLKLGAVANKTDENCWRMPVIPGVHRGNNDRLRLSYKGHGLNWTHVVVYAYTGAFLFKTDIYTKEYLAEPDWPRSMVDLSHKCHVGDCCNPKHLIFEPSPINAQRNMCKWAGECLGLGHRRNPCIFTEDSLRNFNDFATGIAVVPVPGNYVLPRIKPNITKRKWTVRDNNCEEWKPNKFPRVDDNNDEPDPPSGEGVEF